MTQQAHLSDAFPLANGVAIPCLGYGTWRMQDGAETVAAIQTALSLGYRHIDTAAYYRNEASVGQALRASGLPREAVFLTSKVWNTDRGYAPTKAAFQATLDRLGTDYLDLYLIHWPAAANQFDDWEAINRDTWRAMTELYQAGKIRAIGVSNFYPDRLIDLCQFSEIKPMVNQVETHALFQQAAAHEVMAKYGVVHESWGPFAEGRKDFFTNPTLQAIGAKYGKSVAQTALRFLIQSDVVVIPKSTHKERMAENLAVFDFQLSQEDMVAIRALDDGQSAFFSHYDPATVEFLTSLGR